MPEPESENLLPSIDKALYLKKLLSHPESSEGINAFNKLCSHGCDASSLGGLFVWLHYYLTENDDLALTSGSTESLLGGLTSHKLNQLVKNAKKLRDEIQSLKSTELVRHLIAQKMLSPDDLLSGSPLDDALGLDDPRFNGLLNLPQLIKIFSSVRGLDYDRMLTKIYMQVHKNTNTWHDKLIASILNDLFPNEVEPEYNEQALKQWRYRRGLTDSEDHD